jgi:hypothetical protein
MILGKSSMAIHTVLKIIYIDDVIFLKAIKGDNKALVSIKKYYSKKKFFLATTKK